MKINKIAVIGSNSFFGSHFIDYLLSKTPWEVIGISRSPENKAVFLPYFFNKNKEKRFTFFKGELGRNSQKLAALLDKEKPAVVVNFAAQSNVPASWQNPENWFMTNCLGIIRLTHHLKDKTYLRKYLQISTPEVYGPCQDMKENLTYYNPTTPYAASKAAADLFLTALVRTRRFPACFIRSVNVYGSHQQPYRIIPSAIILMKKGEKIVLHGSAVRRNFIHVKDAAAGIAQVIEKGRPGGVYHLSSGQNITIEDLMKLICKRLGSSFDKTVVDSPTKLGKERDKIYHLSCQKTAKELGWQPKISLAEGIDEVHCWVEKYWPALEHYALEYVHKK